jgi:hypothetical protein
LFCPPLAVAVDLKRTDGAHRHLAYHHGAPALCALVRAFLDAADAPTQPPQPHLYCHRARRLSQRY